MREETLNIFHTFHCIGGKCRHSCCLGWEIDVDPDTYSCYETVGGEFGEKLRENIAKEGEDYSFRLGEDERCPFLNSENLCDIIINLGENALCQICADHPRFRNFFSDRTETGVGLCCEEAARLVLSFTEKAECICLFDDGAGEELTPFEEKLLFLRKELFDAAQNRGESLETRLEKVLSLGNASVPEKSLGEWADFYLSLERLDPKWGEILRKLKAAENDVSLPHNLFEIPFEQFLVYFIYRHVSAAYREEEIPERAAFAVLSVMVIKALCAQRLGETGECNLGDLAEFARLYSSEIEYSEENTQAIFQLLRGEKYEL